MNKWDFGHSPRLIESVSRLKLSNHTSTITGNSALNGIVVFLALSKDKPHKSNVDMIEYDKRFLAHEGERERERTVGTTTKLVNFDGLWGPFFQRGLQQWSKIRSIENKWISENKIHSGWISTTVSFVIKTNTLFLIFKPDWINESKISKWKAVLI